MANRTKHLLEEDNRIPAREWKHISVVMDGDGLGSTEAKSGEHMVGIGVYPPEVEKYISDWEFIDDIEKAFDWVLGWQIAPQTHDGGLILNSYRTRDYRIEDGKVTCNNINTSSNSHDYDRPITSKTILHHGCKDQSIVRLMQEGQIPHG